MGAEFMSLFCSGEFQPKSAAAARLRLQTNGALHSFDRFFDDGQANAGALVAPTGTLEDAEDFFMRAVLDADAVVLKENARTVADRFRPHTDARRDARRDKFRGVGHQIRNALRQR